MLLVLSTWSCCKLNIKKSVSTIVKKNFCQNSAPKIILVLLLICFSGYAIYLAVNLQPGMVPDESAHFEFAKHFASTWGIPSDIYETYSLGWYIEGHPFLYQYINGRIINLVTVVSPDVGDWGLLLILRLVNVIYAVGSVIFFYFLAKEVIHHKWWQLLPVFLITHTLMFVFLASGVNYDNLVNLLCIAGIYFFVRMIKNHNFVANSLAWMICITIGTLVKYSVLPLALMMFIIWIIFIIKKRRIIFPLQKFNYKIIVSIGILTLLIFGNLAIYGKNLIVYQSILPACRDILSDSQCEISPFEQRKDEEYLEEKLTIMQSLELDYPDPFEYVVMVWPRAICSRMFGIAGYYGYAPQGITFMYYLVFLWIFLLMFKYWEKPSFTIISLSILFVFYLFVLLIMNYNADLSSGFKHYALQGRYVFPVIGAAFVLVTHTIKNIPCKIFKWGTLGILILLFLVGGPINFLLKYNSIFFSWFQ